VGEPGVRIGSKGFGGGVPVGGGGGGSSRRTGVLWFWVGSTRHRYNGPFKLGVGQYPEAQTGERKFGGNSAGGCGGRKRGGVKG